MTPFPTQSNIQSALRSFLIAVLPPGVPVIAGQQNRAAEPMQGSFVVFTPIRFERLETNIDTYIDAKFTGSIVGTLMTISYVYPQFSGQIEVGSTIFGVGVAANTVVTALVTGDGGLGTYTVSPSQTITSETLSAGSQDIEQPTKATIQCDFHSANDTDAGDMAQTVSTLLRDEFGVDQFANQSPNYGVVPLYSEDPRQTPFLNAEQQYEFRWSVDVYLQVNQVIGAPLQFADEVDVGIISVDAAYGP